MKAIVVVDSNWAIGKDGCLLIHLAGDKTYFREKTLGKVVVMGRATLDSLPGGKPLPGRNNIVLSRNPRLETDCEYCRSLNEAFNILKGYDSDDVFIIGGEHIYTQFLPYCNTAYVTKIDKSFDADRFFPNLDERGDWDLVYEGEDLCDQGVIYRFTEYRRRAGGLNGEGI